VGVVVLSIFLGVSLLLGSFFNVFALVFLVYTLCVLRAALRFFNDICLITYKNKK
jgi:uncharacterized membrane protein YphA (DoxX/SURF4 family)